MRASLNGWFVLGWNQSASLPTDHALTRDEGQRGITGIPRGRRCLGARGAIYVLLLRPAAGSAHVALSVACYTGARERPLREIPMSKILRFLNDESGATAIEYGLIAAGISVAIIAVVNGLGTQLNAKFTSISTQLQ
jgi:pilus assembly protein Flp/PilA